jgi:hypothetical protein
VILHHRDDDVVDLVEVAVGARWFWRHREKREARGYGQHGARQPIPWTGLAIGGFRGTRKQIVCMRITGHIPLPERREELIGRSLPEL